MTSLCEGISKFYLVMNPYEFSSSFGTHLWLHLFIYNVSGRCFGMHDIAHDCVIVCDNEYLSDSP